MVTYVMINLFRWLQIKRLAAIDKVREEELKRTKQELERQGCTPPQASSLLPSPKHKLLVCAPPSIECQLFA